MIISPYMILLLCLSFTKADITNNNDECHLDEDLAKEIQSYRNLVTQMYHGIIDFCGDFLFGEYVKFITNFGPRPSGSQVLEDSIDYVNNLTQSCGIKDFYTEEVPVTYWSRGEESLEIITPRHKKLQILGLGTSVSTPEEGITAEAIVVNNFEELEKLPSEKVTGKIVVYNNNFTSNFSNSVVYRCRGASKATLKGAVAVLVKSITPFSLNTPHAGQQTYNENVTKIPVASITTEDGLFLSRLQSQGKKITLKLKMSSKSEPKTSRNVIIDVKGEKFPKKQVIVSGHLDSWDVGDGAVNNGGGMFISWAVPSILKTLPTLINITYPNPKRTIRSILWTGAEIGHVGALSYLYKHKNELLDINFMLEAAQGTFAPLGLEVAGTKEARCIIQEILNILPHKLLMASDAPGYDLPVFVKQGVPGASLHNMNMNYYWYHNSEADRLELQSQFDVISCAAFWTAVSYVIADISVDIPR